MLALLVAACVVVMALLPQRAQGQSDFDTCAVEPDGGFDCTTNGGVSGFDISPGSKRVVEQVMLLAEDRHDQRDEDGPEGSWFGSWFASAQDSRSRIRLASAPATGGTSAGADQERDGQERRLGVYAGGFGVFEDQNTTDRQIGLQSDRYGGFIGADWKFQTALIGVAVDFSQNDIDFKSDAGDAEQPEIGFGLYGAVDFTDDWYAFTAGRVGLFDYDTDRHLTLGDEETVFSRTSVKGDTEGYNLGIGGGFGYSRQVLDHLILNPSWSLSYFYEKYDGYKEDGFVASGFEHQFHYDSFSDDSLESSLGMAVGFPFDLHSINVVPSVFGAWIYEFRRGIRIS